MKNYLLLFFLFIISIYQSLAQSNCADNIATASKYIDQGKISEAVNLVRPCAYLITNPTRWQAFRILSIASLLQNQNDSALYFATQMLELNPLYKPDLLNDPKDFSQLLKQINVIPKFSLGLAFMYGLNVTFPKINGTYIPTNYSKAYKSKSGFQLGIISGYNFNRKNGVDINMIYNSRKYGMEYISQGSTIKINETLNSLDLALLYRYTFLPQKRMRFNITAGPYCSYLLNSYNDLSIEDSTVHKEVKHYSSLARRNYFTYGIAGGVGLIYKAGHGHISLDARYYKGLKNITKSSGRYDNRTLIYDYAYLDDDIILNNLAVFLGYHLYINYKISK